MPWVTPDGVNNSGSLNAQTDQKVAYVAHQCHLVNFRFPCSIINLHLNMNENLILTHFFCKCLHSTLPATAHLPKEKGWGYELIEKVA